MAAQVLPFQIALDATRLKPRPKESLLSRLESNDETLTHLKLVGKPMALFGDEFSSLLVALQRNRVVTTVELSWRFLSGLPVVDRVRLMSRLGSLISLEKMMVEAIGPCEALVAALEKTQNLKTLWIGALRLASNTDVTRLTQVLRRNVTLHQINLYNIMLPVQGTHQADGQGRVWFRPDETDQQTAKKLDLNPLLTAIADIPTMHQIQLDLRLNPDKMERIRKKTLCRLCQSVRLVLMLGSCDLDDDDCATLAEELYTPESNLEVLNLCNNNRITEFGWASLAQALETNYNLTRLETNYNFTGPSPPSISEPMVVSGILMAQLADFTASHNIASMEPSEHNAPRRETKAKINLLLRLNKMGRKRLLGDPSTTKADWLEFMILDIHDIDVAFYVLQSVPGIFFS